MKEKILYSISTDDVKTVAEESDLSFSKKDLPFIQYKIGDFMGDKWYDAIEYALSELEESKNRK